MSLYAVGVDLGTMQAAGAVPTLVRKTLTFNGTTVGDVGTDALFTVTGDVKVVGLWVKINTTLVDTVDGATFSIGVTGNTARFFDSSSEPLDLDAMTTGVWLIGNSSNPQTASGANLAEASSGAGMAISANILLTVATQAINSGALTVYVEYIPLSAGASVVAA